MGPDRRLHDGLWFRGRSIWTFSSRTSSGTAQQSPRLSLWIGTALVAVGVVVNVAATVRHGQIISQLKRGEWDIQHQSRLGVAIALTLACVGLAMTVYLVVMR
jgi:uncharacterized membrane protein YidH (DUF202 family)